MSRKHLTTRRTFFRSVSLGAAATAWTAPPAVPAEPARRRRRQRLPREVWVASVSQNGLEAAGQEQMIRKMLARMKEVAPLEPDIICLPEVFPFANLSTGRPPVAQVAETPIGAVCEPFARFARDHHCYVVCPVYTRQGGECYNAAVFIDRSGRVMGEYRKIHPTIGEMEAGVAPGPLDPPVFRTDFGVVGAQICFDIEWHDGWQRLAQAGAEIVFWPSAFAGGSMVNTKAWENHYAVVSSTRKDTTKICDVTGEEVARSGRWDKWVCAPLNLEKAFLHTWPYCNRFADIRARYGRKVRIRTFHEEEWTILESRSPEVRIADVMREFELKSHAEHIRQADLAQRARRKAPAGRS
ncbi:MAG TPA: carbon-nitrogen hydrolase family protein [Planctomycetaceae bacterium]|nr:carbon-nitrogen hydrolase family protein [Planctomycetaceae bacterium]